MSVFHEMTDDIKATYFILLLVFYSIILASISLLIVDIGFYISTTVWQICLYDWTVVANVYPIVLCMQWSKNSTLSTSPAIFVFGLHYKRRYTVSPILVCSNNTNCSCIMKYYLNCMRLLQLWYLWCIVEILWLYKKYI